MSGLCTKEKKAIIEYGFGNERSKIYLARKTPVEVKTGWGMPPTYYPPNSTTYKTAEVWESTVGGGVFAFKHYYAFGWEVPENHPIEGKGIRAYYLSPGRGNEPPSISYGDFRSGDQFFQGEQYYQQLRNVQARELFGGDGMSDGIGYIEIFLDGVASYKDFGKGQAWYKVNCGNGCAEDEEVEITEINEYPGHWCLTNEQLNRMRSLADKYNREGRKLKTQEREIDKQIRQMDQMIKALNKV